MIAKIPILAASLALVLAGCGLLSFSQAPAPVAGEAHGPAHAAGFVPPAADGRAGEKGTEVVLFALGLVETGYRFGGKNPEAGLDCSGMVRYVFDKVAGMKLSGSAADIARKGRPVDMANLQPGDLVFFNTLNRPYSHVGIYIGDGRFVHAPSSSGKVRTESLREGWFATRFEEARSFLN
jgi:cell wall-associated NlpC family hydrolase